MPQILLAGTFFCFLLSVWQHQKGAMHILQIEEYLSGRFIKWALHHLRRFIFLPELLIGLFVVLVSLVITPSEKYLPWLLFVISWVFVVGLRMYVLQKENAQTIKPLVYTARIKRLAIGVALIVFIEIVLLIQATTEFSPDRLYAFDSPVWRLATFLLCLLAIAQFTFINVALANILLFPIEELIRFYYIFTAQRKMRTINPVVIGITGSYGKTTTKEILAQLLSTRYNVLKTPRSYNTLMGICKVIREDLKPQHRFFVVEMGAYKPGEIARICRLVRPRVGIITAVGPMHLERFKTIENVAKAKYELIQSLPPNGTAIFNGDDPVCVRLSQETKIPVLKYGVQCVEAGLNLLAQNISVDGKGSQFELVEQGKLPQKARTQLLGRHNVSNILAATLAALQFEISFKEVIRALAALSPVEHRLQLIKGANGITYLDDAYNSNPIGASVALEVLGMMSGSKFLVTPGFVELGKIEYSENQELGRKAASVCDHVFLVGGPQRAEPIIKGLEEKQFDMSHVLVFDRLDQAREKLREMVKPDDWVLFENDLPDTYIQPKP